MKLWIAFLFSVCVMLSCKKDKLEGEFSFLEGEWDCYKMAYVTYSSGNCNYDTIYDGGNRKITFYKRGKILFEKDSEKVECVSIRITKLDGQGGFQVSRTNKKDEDFYMRMIFNPNITEFYTQYFPPQEVFGINCRHIYYFRKL